MDIELRNIVDLRPHPENESIFGYPEDAPEYDRIRKSIKERGLDEPVVIRPDGTILSGHLRVAALYELGKTRVECRVRDFGDDYFAELQFVVGSNTQRRHLTKEQIAWAFDRLTKLQRELGGTRRQKGGDTRSKKPGKNADQSGASPTMEAEQKGRDEAAEILGVGTDKARALQAVFVADDVPEEVKSAVNSGAVAPTPAAKTIKSERKRQGGKIIDPEPLKAWVGDKTKPREQPKPAEDHEQRVLEQAKAFQRDMAELVDLYKRLHSVVSRRPLKTVIGPTEHHEYTQYLRDIALLAWRQVEEVTGDTKTGRQMALHVVNGGKS